MAHMQEEQKVDVMGQLLHGNKEKVEDLESRKSPPWERPLFLIIITFTGGYMNAYTYVTRNETLANMHTANMSKLGISIALGEWKNALIFFIPIVACILGAAFSEWIKDILNENSCEGDWRKIALILESIALFCVGLMPLNVPDIIVTTLVSFFMGYQLCLFRKCLGVAHNTTICTGNIRNVGQLLYKMLDKKSKDSVKQLIIFATLTFSFAAGAIPGTIVSNTIGTKAVWICSIILLVQTIWINMYEFKH